MDYITSAEAAELLGGVTANHIRLLIKRGTLRAVKRGHDWWVERPSVEAYAATERKRGPKAKPESG